MGIVFAELWVEAATFKFGSTRVTDGKERFATVRAQGISEVECLGAWESVGLGLIHNFRKSQLSEYPASEHI